MDILRLSVFKFQEIMESVGGLNIIYIKPLRQNNGIIYLERNQLFSFSNLYFKIGSSILTMIEAAPNNNRFTMI